MGTLANTRLLRRPWIRRTIFLVLVVLCALLTLFPERYRAAVTLTPTDPSSLGLGAALGQLGALNTVFGNQAAIEISIKLANSVYVRQTVAKRLNLREKLGTDSPVAMSRWLDKNLVIRTMRGGIVQIETFNPDAAFARSLVGAVAEATRKRLAEIARRQTAYKRQVLLELVDGANDRLSKAQLAYNIFRLRNRYSNPTYSLDAIASRVPVVQATIKAKEVELSTARKFGTDESMAVKQVLAELAELQRQLAQLQTLSPRSSGSVGRAVEQSTEAERLERELATANSLYYGYRNYLQGTSVEDLTSAANLRILEPPYVDTARQLNFIPFTIGILLGLLALGIEFYGARPPVSGRFVPA